MEQKVTDSEASGRSWGWAPGVASQIYAWPSHRALDYASFRCGSLRLESANLKENGLVHGEFTVLRRASLTRHSEKCRSLGVAGSPLAWLLTLSLACPSVYVLEAALPLLSSLELLMKPIDQCRDGLAITAIRAQSIKVLDLDQEALVRVAARSLAMGESSTTSCGQLITSELPHSSLPLGRRPTQARQWGHACSILLYIYWVCVGQIQNKNLHPSRRRSFRTLVYAVFYKAGGNWRARRADFVLELHRLSVRLGFKRRSLKVDPLREPGV